MITEQDLQEAIAECQGVRNPNASTAIKLAAFLTIQKELFGSDAVRTYDPPPYSFAPAPPEKQFSDSGPETVGDYGSSEFLQAVADKKPSDVWPIIDELMDTLKMVNQRVYNGIMRKIQ